MLFFNAYTQKYGTELYAGKAGNDGISFSSSIITQETPTPETEDTRFGAKLYPNPVTGPATLVITGASPETTVSITDMHGNTIWQHQYTGGSLTLPAQNFASGVYIITVKSGTDSKNIKMVKQ
jgi:hypothetical protein